MKKTSRIEIGGGDMRVFWMLALLLGAIFVAGCLGGSQPAAGGVTQTPTPTPNATTPSTGTPANTSQPAAPATVNNSVTPPPAPVTPPASGTLVWDAKKALKITLLRKGDSLAFDTLKIRLDNIVFQGRPLASYSVLDSTNAVLKTFTLGQNESIRFTAPSNEEYLFVAIFNIGEGLPNAVQTQVYRTRDLLSASSGSSQIGIPENSYTLGLQYPKPVMLANQTIGIGQTVLARDALGVQLTEIDRSTRPVGASIRVSDASGAEIGTAKLQGGQMVQVRIDTQHRYYVVLQTVDATSDRAPVMIYQGMSFVDANYTIGGN